MKNTNLHFSLFHITTVLFIVCIGTTSLQAQGPASGYGEKLLFRGLSGVTFGGITQTWTIKDSGTVQQYSAPVSVSLPISNRVLLSLSSAAATAKFDTANIQGVTDTRLSLSYVFPGDKLWLVAGVSFPTGHSKLSANEIAVTTLLSQTAFGYKVPVFGQGLNGNLGLTYAMPITRRFIAGFGINYFYKGKYEPVSIPFTTISYAPGGEVSGNIGFDYITLSKKFRFSADLNGTYFFQDKLNNTVIFQSGVRFIGFFAATIRTESFLHSLQMRSRFRGENSYFTNGLEKKFPSVLQFELQYGAQKTLSSWLTGTLNAEIKNYSEDQIPVGAAIITTGKALVYGAGIDMLFTFSNFILPDVSVKYNQGTVTLENTPLTVTGFEAGINLKMAF